MREIVIQKSAIPENVTDLAKFVLIGRDRLAAVRAAIKAIDKVGVAGEVYKQKLAEAQEIAETVLDAEMKLGELRKNVERSNGNQYKSAISPRGEIALSEESLGHGIAITPLKQFDETAGLDKHLASHIESMASHPDVVERVKEEARQHDEIVTRKAVLDAIKKDKRQEKEEAREKKREENEQKVETLATPLEAKGVFKTIVIDPPWNFDDEGDHNQFGRARPDYKTMSIEEMVELPIGRIADKNSHLYIWATNRSLPKAFRLMAVWGFRYITCLTWVKPSIGLGNYYRGDTEHVLFGVKGSLPLKRHDVGTHFNAPRGKAHSDKPDLFYEIVESCSVGPYIDVFGRKEREGWTVWGENG